MGVIHWFLYPLFCSVSFSKQLPAHLCTTVRGCLLIIFFLSSLPFLCCQELYETTSEEEGGDDELDDEDGLGLDATNGVIDLEDMGRVAKKMTKAKVGLVVCFSATTCC